MTDNKATREKTEFAPRKVEHAATPADVAKARAARLAALQAAAEAQNTEDTPSED